ncbi:cobyric acid synthase [Halobacteria archaeon AArc-curdl1]|uniref:Probable cobyric acid synthase n=1 Tax=Natronosalvus hydrolyticus TaxID=2979988 RepID=A0AAP2Z7P6_9EURY|nr:cobyric acid synthase [Halobacteria archaeon AArc-curdl1]
MARTILVAGTASHVGKSTVAAGLCRLLADRGVSVVPYKAQNMSNNARVVYRAGSDGQTDGDSPWGEIGVSQFVQARAARTTPTTDVNPVLLKPRGDGESQLIVQGRAVDHLAAGSYYDEHWQAARTAAEESHRRLAAEHDVVVAEGAGSIAEINLHHRDLANLETARFSDADVLLVVDIERGGAFASLYGTVELLPEDIRDRLAGAIITKFRGDERLLEPGLEDIESRTGVPVLGVIPYDDPGLPEEDSLGLPATDERTIRGGDDVHESATVTIAVPRLPHLSNAADIEALVAEPGVRVAFVPLESDSAEATETFDPLENADAVVIPGTKNTVDDLEALYQSGVGAAIARFDGPIVGLCGGFQMLGTQLHNSELEAAASDATSVEGLGVLPIETMFDEAKQVRRTTVQVDESASPLVAGATGSVTGYEIHAGRTRPLDTASNTLTSPFEPSSAATGLVLGTYLHGVFENDSVRRAFVRCVRRRAGCPPDAVRRRNQGGATDTDDESVTPYDRAAGLVETHVDLGPLGLPGR